MVWHTRTRSPSTSGRGSPDKAESRGPSRCTSPLDDPVLQPGPSSPPSPPPSTAALVAETRLNNSLTSLSWLRGGFSAAGSACAGANGGEASGWGHGMHTNQAAAASEEPEIESDYEDDFDRMDWRRQTGVKPPFSYATLIHEAIKSSQEGKLTLSAIYTYIETHYVYYQTVETGWKNSIRHNLSQNKCFVKLSRTEDRPGKGGYWAVAADQEHILEESATAKRRRRHLKSKAEQRRRARQRHQLGLPPIATPPRRHTQAGGMLSASGIFSQLDLASSAAMRDGSFLVPQLFGRDGRRGGGRARGEQRKGRAQSLGSPSGSPEPQAEHPWAVSPDKASLMASEQRSIRLRQASGAGLGASQTLLPASLLTCSLNGSLTGLGMSGGLAFPLTASFSEVMNPAVVSPSGLDYGGHTVASRPQSRDDGDLGARMVIEDVDEGNSDDDDAMAGLKTPSDWLQ